MVNLYKGIRMKKIAIIVIAFLMLGCAKKAPECNSVKAKSLVIDATKDYVKNHYKSSIRDKLNFRDFNSLDDIAVYLEDKAKTIYESAEVKLDLIRVDSVDDVALKTSCSADIVDNLDNRLSITYILQLTDDNRLVVEIYKDRT